MKPSSDKHGIPKWRQMLEIFCAVRRLTLKRHDCATCGLGASNDERVCIQATLQELFSLYDLEKMRNLENLTDDGCLGRTRRRKQIALTRCPISQRSNSPILNLPRNFSR
jgi:hypothetical protein